MGETKCFYHYDNVAVNKCDRCKRDICEECAQFFPQKNKNDSSKTNKKLCPQCNFDAYSGARFTLIVMCMFLFMYVVSAMSGTAAGVLIPLIIWVLALIGGNIIIRVKAGEMKPKAKKILKAAQEARYRDLHKRKPIQVPKDTPTESILQSADCKFCGAPIPIHANECSYCGMVWIWKH